MIQIGELVLRIPGIDAERGNTLGNDVAKLVAAGLPSGIANQKIDALNIKMNQSDFNQAGNMAATIANQIIDQVKLATLK